MQPKAVLVKRPRALYLRIKGFRPYRFTDYKDAAASVTKLSDDLSAAAFYSHYGQPTITDGRGKHFGYVARDGKVYCGDPTQPKDAILIFTPHTAN